MKIFLHTGKTVRLVNTAPRQKTTDEDRSERPTVIRGRWRDKGAHCGKIPR
jgi:hypothetical protein